MHGTEAPSAWIRRWSHLVPAGSTVLDLACGHGRHTRWFAGRGHPVLALDRAQAALDSLAELAGSGGVRTLCADIEGGPWPLDGQLFGAVVVSNYLWRAVWPRVAECVQPGGVLLYETFAVGQQTLGKPSRPDFLLQPGELLHAFAGLRVVAFEDGFDPAVPRFVQRIAAVREVASDLPARHVL